MNAASVLNPMKRITPALRKKLKKPLGRLFGPNQAKALKAALLGKKVMAVGDATVMRLHKLGIPLGISVYDLKTKRVELPKKSEEFFHHLAGERIICVNPAGYITPSLEKAVQKALSSPETHHKIFVIGEEDLAAIPFLMHAHVGAVCYGQPGKGIVVVEASAEAREKAEKIYHSFRNVHE